ncbi:PhzF family phenazine biosynthesis protein [Longimicrobium terrae]|uniref:Trans-2,3-dihydro-3-hydroxyanthranilate isomerase n=1 Tax=Longimicrobium terrae TaxID=1639882 RepID=A0A841H263_9BACT|nr:PhzF family phenazine biosynthesis protein [Longimicrobium terrae]MBB4637686.1 trans-2,3-dihydro-3-hydroxyanthranilate isomerase [Longimicrobium terrae]MBB6072083.1 trans-2,3-dihydro-3-hydroxyanthranilate isomerase [Longimicrobium terrae]NNC29833.1 PhzF family phenazine biosynthesis protein [Longimicrobium terrae]
MSEPRTFQFHTLDVFTDRVFGGNPLAVFPDAAGLSGEDMRQIAREFNLSETVFVFPPENAAHTARLRIFTPGMELPFAGHPTVGTALLLSWLGRVPLAGDAAEAVLEEGVGPVRVALSGQGGRADFARLTAAVLPEWGPPAPTASILAQLLSLDPDEIGADGFEAETVSCGVPFQIIPVRDTDVLSRARLNRATWNEHVGPGWAPHVYVFTPDGESADLRARMFAPAMGIDEDPATGAAASAFAGYLARRLDGAPERVLRWSVAQGVEMGRPSLLHLEADIRGGEIAAVRVGGGAVPVTTGHLTLPVADAS